MDVLIHLIVLFISQCICVLNHYIWFYLPIMPNKSGKKRHLYIKNNQLTIKIEIERPWNIRAEES